MPPNADPAPVHLLNQELRFQKGIGPRRASELEQAGVHTLDDLLHRFPIRFEDRSQLQRSTDLKPGESAALCGEVVALGEQVGVAAPVNAALVTLVRAREARGPSSAATRLSAP